MKASKTKQLKVTTVRFTSMPKGKATKGNYALAAQSPKTPYQPGTPASGFLG